jgi:hypothetical protein
MLLDLRAISSNINILQIEGVNAPFIPEAE